VAEIVEKKDLEARCQELRVRIEAGRAFLDRRKTDLAGSTDHVSWRRYGWDTFPSNFNTERAVPQRCAMTDNHMHSPKKEHLVAIGRFWFPLGPSRLGFLNAVVVWRSVCVCFWEPLSHGMHRIDGRCVQELAAR
jgi:hypothetical protein